MAFEITNAEIWTCEIEDRPNSLAERLADVVRAGANLDCAIVRPSDRRPGWAALYITPIEGPEQEWAALHSGFKKSASIHAIRVAGPDRAGLIAGIAGVVAAEHINISGLTGCGTGDRALVYLRFATPEEAAKAAKVLAAKLK
jgi:hypothetical protein